MQKAPAIRNSPEAAQTGRMSLRHPAIGYLGAVLLIAIALLIRLSIDPWVGNASRTVVFMTFTALSAFAFGRGPGIFATVLSVAAADYFFFPPQYSFHGKSYAHTISLLSAVLEGILLSFCAGYFHRALRLRAEAENKLRLLYETERLAHESSDEANRMKDYFLAVLSHELRGPLTAIQYCVADRLQDQSAAPGLQADFELINRNVKMQSRLISDLLDLTRISRGKMEIDPRPLDVHQLITETVRSCYPANLMQSSPAPALSLRAPEFWVAGDRDRLFQILWNILRNAGKFTPPDGRIEVETFQPAPGRIAIRVRDTGIGLTDEALQRIFQPFEQAAALRGKKEGGLGLGLPIARGLAELHGGILTGASEGPGCGTAFTLDLPVVARPAHGPESLSAISPAALQPTLP